MAPVDETPKHRSALVAAALKEAMDPVSSDDISWADSCLADDLESSSNIDMGAIKNALLETLDFRPRSLVERSPVDYRRGFDLSQSFKEVVSEEDLKSFFQPHYSEDENTMARSVSPKLESFDEIDEMSENIFKVWDLPSLGDEVEDSDSLENQLNKALSEYSPLPSQTQPNAESWTSNDLPVSSVDDLISSIDNLSLDTHWPPSSR